MTRPRRLPQEKDRQSRGAAQAGKQIAFSVPDALLACARDFTYNRMNLLDSAAMAKLDNNYAHGVKRL